MHNYLLFSGSSHEDDSNCGQLVQQLANNVLLLIYIFIINGSSDLFSNHNILKVVFLDHNSFLTILILEEMAGLPWRQAAEGEGLGDWFATDVAATTMSSIVRITSILVRYCSTLNFMMIQSLSIFCLLNKLFTH